MAEINDVDPATLKKMIKQARASYKKYIIKHPEFSADELEWLKMLFATARSLGGIPK